MKALQPAVAFPHATVRVNLHAAGEASHRKQAFAFLVHVLASRSRSRLRVRGRIWVISETRGQSCER